MLKDLMSPESASAENTCAGCGLSIKDRFYLLAADRAWHGQCLRCCRCSQPLDTELSCFCRGGNIYCKEDYCRIFSTTRCAKCGDGLSSSELVMRAREMVFHVTCFSCTLCGAPLSTGDTAAIRGGRVFCGEHYDVDILHLESSELNLTPSPQFYCGSPQKGRPRKRKPPAVQPQETPSDNIEQQTPLRLELISSDVQSGSLDLSYDGSSHSPGSGGCLTPQTRTKRMRTSFKHHQLRTMKSYFAINQNPDAKDLKQLAQKTGLSKRVLQVWFQNARAKWRRNLMRQETQPPIQGSGKGSSTMTGLTVPGNTQGGTGEGNPTSASSHALDEMHQMTFAELY
ncbi:LIM/homeobox protein Lhx9-like isoform X1 [Phlebotomus papatasi]|uniref:LIM/homeobox protein Lhx9-like isoform X1 n=1 Tax=Phlebotomus papatasi TaxID=29031 RepID=UPI00248466BE|nr:LIM/homeobox protein Lhx9-like isoform X1 [Phlebotomus papatasi]